MSRQVIAVVETNLLWEELAAVADRLRDDLDKARFGELRVLVDRAIGSTLAGGAAAIGWPEVMDSPPSCATKALEVVSPRSA